MDISTLLTSIRDTHQWFAGQAARQIDTSLTLRNWLIGMYLVEYEQKGQDRAQYGKKLLPKISASRRQTGMRGMDERRLREYRFFYETYPQVVTPLTNLLHVAGNKPLGLVNSLAEQQIEIRRLLTAKSYEAPPNDINQLLNRLTYTHFVELMRCDTDLKRTFYETQAMLNRQPAPTGLCEQVFGQPPVRRRIAANHSGGAEKALRRSASSTRFFQ